MLKSSRISAAPQAEDLEAPGHLLSEVLDALSDAALVADLDTLRVEYANRSLQAVLGYAPQDFIGERLVDLYPDSDAAEAFRAALADALRAGTGFRSEQVFVGPGGERTWTEMTIRLIPSGMPTKLVAIVRDITDRKLWEDALVQSHARLELLNSILRGVERGMPVEAVVELGLQSLREHFHGIRVSYGTIDDEGLLQVRQSFPAGGLDPLDGTSVDLTQSPAYLSALRAGDAVVVEDVRADGAQCRAVLDDAARAVLHVPMEYAQGVALLQLDSPAPVGWNTHAVTTVTEVASHLSLVLKDAEATKIREQLEEQLRHSQKMEAVGRLAGGVAHDFNNILTGITGYVELVLSEIDEPRPRRDLEQIIEFSRRAAGLTQQLLAFSRRQSLAVTGIDVNELVITTSSLIDRLIGEDIELTVEAHADGAVVRGDAGQIEQVLMNLAVNARDAMPDGGRLMIEASTVKLDAEHVRAHDRVSPGDHVMVSVTDTGVGIDGDDREHIFEPFFTTKRRGQGTGLGLSTVYGIVKQHGGKVWVYSEPGRGSCFKIYLPVSDLAATSPRGEVVSQAIPRGTETILLVEDEPHVCEALQRALQAHGYSVRSALDADEAEELVRDDPAGVDLLVTDVVMPGCDGLELHRRLRGVIADLPVLFLSGYTDRKVLEEGVVEPGRPFLQKPFSPARLLREVRSVLDDDAADRGSSDQ